VTKRGWHPLAPRNLAAVVAVVVLLLVAKDLFYPRGFRRAAEPTIVLVPRGATVDGIARELAGQGLIKSPFAFGLLARVTGVDRSLKAGQYRLYRGASTLSILRALARGMSGEGLVVLPEGLSMRDIARILDPRLAFSAEEFLAACSDTALLNTLEIPAPSVEGYLAPSSYEFLPATPPDVVLRRLVGETRRVLAEELATGSPVAHELTSHEILTLASIVEAETGQPAERPRIAAVYLNRLRQGMRLQADPTVAYALGGYRERLYYSDLRVDSPYNTYRYAGLPPGPIGNPGRASIHAVLWPMPGSRELFFVARGDGAHVFNETGEAHEAARIAIRAMRAARPALADSTADSTASLLRLPAQRAGLVPALPAAAAPDAPAAADTTKPEGS
jgi:UPF0755 protein